MYYLTIVISIFEIDQTEKGKEEKERETNLSNKKLPFQLNLNSKRH